MMTLLSGQRLGSINQDSFEGRFSYIFIRGIADDDLINRETEWNRNERVYKTVCIKGNVAFSHAV